MRGLRNCHPERSEAKSRDNSKRCVTTGSESIRHAETYSLDGCKIVDLDSFYDEVSADILPGVPWGRNLDAFNDILRGGFGTPEDGFVLQWASSAVSRKALGPELFDELVEIVRDHGRGGKQSGSRIELRLE